MVSPVGLRLTRSCSPLSQQAEQKAWEHQDWEFENLRLFKSDFSYLPLGKFKIRKVGCLKIPDFSESDLSYLTLGKTRKAGCEKVRVKNLQYPRLRPGHLEVQNYMVGSVGVNWVPLG